tara:strand:+ start:953 stop:1108 length:156 start_codon:yes stop_codon:yes gene_type:complete
MDKKTREVRDLEYRIEDLEEELESSNERRDFYRAEWKKSWELLASLGYSSK